MSTPRMKHQFCIITLGCKINQYESQAIREAWQRTGWHPTDDAAQADILLVNSCAVTAGALRDVRTTVRKAMRANPQARIIVTGCAAESDRNGLGDLTAQVEFVSQSDKTTLLAGPPHPGSIEGDRAHVTLSDFRPKDDFRISDYERGRAVLKIQDGCSHRCTYCIIPLARGEAKSRPLEEILAETDRLINNGFGEITISGINLSQYGRDEKSTHVNDMWDLLQLLNERYAAEYLGKVRFRLSSLYPAQITGKMKEKALQTLAASPMVCPHLHLSLQSLAPEVLRRMGRKTYDVQGIHDFLNALEAIWPVYALGADFICGFPGETEENFQETFEAARGLPLSYAHVFPYSIRPGTVAADMEQTVSQTEKKERAKRLRDMISRKKTSFINKLNALDRVEVALEKSAPARGMNQYYIECIFQSPASDAQIGKLVAAQPLSPSPGNEQTLLVRAI